MGCFIGLKCKPSASKCPSMLSNPHDKLIQMMLFFMCAFKVAIYDYESNGLKSPQVRH